jgi:hypothetical protein
MKKTLYTPKGKRQTTQSIMERVKTFEDACEITGKNILEIEINGLDKHSDSIIGYAKLTIINEALNMQEDGTVWKPDWTDSKQYKYYPYFNNASSSVGGFSYDDYGGWHTGTGVGSRLCYSSSELAKYAGTQFLAEYNEFLSL